MLIKTFACAVQGIDAQKITVEVNAKPGVNFFMVGLADSAVKESQQRIYTAVSNLEYKLPTREYTINLAPANIRKEGSSFDLPIAIGLLASAEQIKMERCSQYVMMGELALDGILRPVKGSLSMALMAKRQGYKGIILPAINANEASVVEDLHVIGAENIKEVIDFINEDSNPESWINVENEEDLDNSPQLDFLDVKGHESVKRALEIACAGGHNILLIGPPGCGKTMMAKRLPTILPQLSMEESLETTMIHSVAGCKSDKRGLLKQRPFRSPHHTISDVALVGGGSNPKPGEISLAHNGILFLDELPEFKRTALEVMRQPLEDQVVSISRARISVDYPANFMLVASMNPSPSGDFYNPDNPDKNNEWEVKRYLGRVSGPLLDRIDLHIEVTSVGFDDLSALRHGESSSEIRKRVVNARDLQTTRYSAIKGIHTNSQLTPSLMKTHCKTDQSGHQLLKTAMDKMGFSARSYTRILKVARTIADLEGSRDISSAHIAEAVQYRSLDRKVF